MKMTAFWCGLWLACISQSSVFGQTVEQRELLGEIGRAIAFSRSCASAEADAAGISSAMIRAGLSPQGFGDKGDRNFSIVERSSLAAYDEAGALDQKVRCGRAVDEYGPRGSRRNGLVRLIATAAAPASISRTISAFDFLVDGQSLVGSTVSISDCTIHYARADLTMCAVSRNNRDLGTIILDGPSMNRDSLRVALEKCADVSARRTCRVKAINGTVRKTSMGDLRIDQASIEWAGR